MNEKSLITDEQSFDGASYASGYSIQTYDDGFGPLWISRNSIGINGIVRAKTWEDAYSICEDEFFPEADETIEEIVKEYGFKREHKKVVRDANGERFERYPEDYPNGKLAVEFVRWETIETPDPEAWSENELFQEAFAFVFVANPLRCWCWCWLLVCVFVGISQTTQPNNTTKQGYLIKYLFQSKLKKTNHLQCISDPASITGIHLYCICIFQFSPQGTSIAPQGTAMRPIHFG
jgi:hypothetical protein